MLLSVFFSQAISVYAITEAEVEAVGKETASGNIFIWFLCAIAFLKVSQKVDSFLSSLGINVGNTGGSMLGELMIATKAITSGKNIVGGSKILQNFSATSSANKKISNPSNLFGSGTVGRKQSNPSGSAANGKANLVSPISTINGNVNTVSPVGASNEKTNTINPASVSNEKINTRNPVSNSNSKINTKNPISSSNEKVNTKNPVSSSNTKSNTITSVSSSNREVNTSRSVSTLNGKVNTKNPVSSSSREMNITSPTDTRKDNTVQSMNSMDMNSVEVECVSAASVFSSLEEGTRVQSTPSFQNTITEIEEDGSCMIGTELSSVHPDGIAYAMYNAEYYKQPEGNYETITDNNQTWYKQYAQNSIERTPYMNGKGQIAYHETPVQKLPDKPTRKGKDFT